VKIIVNITKKIFGMKISFDSSLRVCQPAFLMLVDAYFLRGILKIQNKIVLYPLIATSIHI
jgi:hypothetical protein